MRAPSWERALPVGLGRDELHVWRISLERTAYELSQFERSLTPAELLRARRFATPELRDRFVAARGLSRRCLGYYLETPADSVPISEASHGKPYVPDSPLRFNLSHSRGWAALAVSREFEVGIDHQNADSSVEIEAISKQFFSAAEHQEFMDHPPEERLAEFFRYWTCKEAFVKGLGQGLSIPLSGFDVSCKLGHESRLMATRFAPELVDRWRLLSFCPAPGFEAAVAFCNPVCVVRFFEC